MPGGRIGIAPHSLRAVTLDDLAGPPRPGAASRRTSMSAEQTREVDDCLAAHGRRPIDLLMDTRRGRRALVPRPCHPRRRRRTRAHRQGEGRRRPLPDHRSQSRRRPVRRAGLPRQRRPLRRRLGFQRPHLRRRRAAHPRIRPAPDPSPAQRAGRRRPARPAGACSRPRSPAAHKPRARPTTRSSPSTPPVISGDAILDHWLFAADNAAIVSVERDGVRLVDHGRHKDRDRIAARYRKTLSRLLA